MAAIPAGHWTEEPPVCPATPRETFGAATAAPTAAGARPRVRDHGIPIHSIVGRNAGIVCVKTDSTTPNLAWTWTILVVVLCTKSAIRRDLIHQVTLPALQRPTKTSMKMSHSTSILVLAYGSLCVVPRKRRLPSSMTSIAPECVTDVPWTCSPSKTSSIMCVPLVRWSALWKKQLMAIPCSLMDPVGRIIMA